MARTRGAKVCLVVACLTALLISREGRSEDKVAKVEVIAVQASEAGKKPVQVAENLKSYTANLKAAAPGFGKFDAAGSDSCDATAGKSAKASASGYTLEATVVKNDGQATVKYVITDSGGKQIGTQTVALKAGSTQAASAGKAESPVVFLVNAK